MSNGWTFVVPFIWSDWWGMWTTKNSLSSSLLLGGKRAKMCVKRIAYFQIGQKPIQTLFTGFQWISMDFNGERLSLVISCVRLTFTSFRDCRLLSIFAISFSNFITNFLFLGLTSIGYVERSIGVHHSHPSFCYWPCYCALPTPFKHSPFTIYSHGITARKTTIAIKIQKKQKKTRIGSEAKSESQKGQKQQKIMKTLALKCRFIYIYFELFSWFFLHPDYLFGTWHRMFFCFLVGSFPSSLFMAVCRFGNSSTDIK